jgi:hypothetical protein
MREPSSWGLFFFILSFGRRVRGLPIRGETIDLLPNLLEVILHRLQAGRAEILKLHLHTIHRSDEGEVLHVPRGGFFPVLDARAAVTPNLNDLFPRHLSLPLSA